MTICANDGKLHVARGLARTCCRHDTRLLMVHAEYARATGSCTPLPHVSNGSLLSWHLKLFVIMFRALSAAASQQHFCSAGLANHACAGINAQHVTKGQQRTRSSTRNLASGQMALTRVGAIALNI